MTETLLGARRLRALLDRHGVTPQKSLGQNFVIDPNTIRKVVSVAEIGATDTVLEVGAGAGSLTLGLAEAAGRVVAVEKDRHLVPVLEETTGDLGNVEIVHADAAAIDLASTGASKLVANLPYNIAATLVLLVLESAPEIRDLTVMTQKEVGLRLAAGPGSKTYGLTSVRASFFARARVAAQISRRAFWPVPRVDSVLLSLVRRDSLPDVDRDRFYEVTGAAFAQRRKTLRNVLTAIAPLDLVERACAAAGVDPGARAEQVDLEGFLRLTRELS